MNDLKFLKVTNQADVTKAARLDLFGAIGGDFWSAGIDESVVKEAMSDIADDQPIDVYINSPGGSVFTAIAIYNLLARHKGAVTITVAGLAASAATIITSVPGAKVVMPKGSLMLIHPVRQSADAMTVDELKEASENLEKIRVSVRDIYQQKCKRDPKSLDDLMSKESFLTAQEAVELGFADVYDDSQEIENKLAADAVMFGGLKVDASIFASAPEGFFKADQRKASAKTKEVEIMDLDTLKAEHPELVEQIRAEALKEGADSERARIQAIEEIAVAGHSDLVHAAKFENSMTAEALAVAILKAEKAKAAQMSDDIEKDSKDAFAGLDAPTASADPLPGSEARMAADDQKQKIVAAGRKGFARNRKTK